MADKIILPVDVTIDRMRQDAQVLLKNRTSCRRVNNERGRQAITAARLPSIQYLNGGRLDCPRPEV
jgi:hypothetical protein